MDLHVVVLYGSREQRYQAEFVKVLSGSSRLQRGPEHRESMDHPDFHIANVFRHGFTGEHQHSHTVVSGTFDDGNFHGPRP